MCVSPLQLFDSVANRDWASSAELHLVGVVCYYGKHYSTFFFHSKKAEWISFDDATVKQVGTITSPHLEYWT